MLPVARFLHGWCPAPEDTMRHSLNIVVALLSMAAGAWQGTTAHSEQPGPTARRPAPATPATPVVLRGCVEKGAAPGTFLLVTRDPMPEPGLEPASAPASRAQPQGGRGQASTGAPRATKAAYEVVSGAPGIDLARLVGKRVEAHGTPERTAPGATASDSPEAAAAAADTPTGRPPAGTTGQTPQRLRVRITFVGPVAGPCE
jgi:hypothetical protein